MKIKSSSRKIKEVDENTEYSYSNKKIKESGRNNSLIQNTSTGTKGLLSFLPYLN
jgi:hypothetical protein